MSRPVWEMADVIAGFGEPLRQSGRIGTWQKKTLTDLGQCRTALLGGHVDACTVCGQLRVSYNSCRNRNCPKCQSLEREAWILGREADLLPVTYYHVVFTMPSELNGLCLHNPRFMYDTLFDSAWSTLQKFAADPKWLGAQTGATMVLHTWGQNLSLHPHAHCIVPGGGRYTHKTAISNHRLLEVTDTAVRFSYKDYRAEGKRKEMTLEGVEFLRRFTLHFPPKGFRRMRHCGILSNTQKGKALAACRQSLSPDEVPVLKKTRQELRAAALAKLLDGRPPNWCACCKAPTMVRIGVVPPQRQPFIDGARAPPGSMPHWQPATDWTN